MSPQHPQIPPGHPRIRTALVTGASRGIGAAVAAELGRRGIDVALTYRTGRAEAERVADRLRHQHGIRAITLPFDMEDQGSAEAVVAATVTQLGGVEALVVNAGRWAGGPLARMDEDAWWDVVSTNVRGMRAIVKAALPALAQAAGSVVLVSSVVGLVGFAGDTAYASAKAAMVGFGRSLAKEVARDGVRVNVLAPGFVETDMTAAVPRAARARITERVLLRRFGAAEEVARAAAFLAVDATYCTGTVLTADGGWTL
jgi:3-oxoacyl-[acyl-carrier protein] reductase